VVHVVHVQMIAQQHLNVHSVNPFVVPMVDVQLLLINALILVSSPAQPV
jgi:hypothetical protein